MGNPTFYNQRKMKIIKGDLILKEDTIINDNLRVQGDIKGDYNLTVKGNINCRNIDCGNISCGNITCWNLSCADISCADISCADISCANINCIDINCIDINCWDINCWDINCWDINFYAVCIAYKALKCNSAKARRINYVLKCLDKEIEYK